MIMKALGFNRRKQYIQFLETMLIEIPKDDELPENAPDSDNSER